MYTIHLPNSDKVRIIQTSKEQPANTKEIAKILNYLLGQGYFENLMTPILDKFNIDKDSFFDYFWNYIDFLSND